MGGGEEGKLLDIVKESSYHGRSIIYPDEGASQLSPASQPHDQQPTGQDRNISHPGPGDDKDLPCDDEDEIL
jgi:hypothetical protein